MSTLYDKAIREYKLAEAKSRRSEDLSDAKILEMAEKLFDITEITEIILENARKMKKASSMIFMNQDFENLYRKVRPEIRESFPSEVSIVEKMLRLWTEKHGSELGNITYKVGYSGFSTDIMVTFMIE